MAAEIIVLEVIADFGSGDETLYFATDAVPSSAGLDIQVRVTDVPEYQKGIGLWIWESTSNSSITDFVIANADGKYDGLLTAIVRDKSALIKTGNTGDDYSTFTTIADLTVDRIVATEDDQLRVIFLDEIVFAEVTLQQSFWSSATSPNSNLEGRPVPYSFGLVYQVRAQAYDGTVPAYGIVQEQGGPASILDVSSDANPALTSQYGIAQYGFDMTISPAGKVTSSFYAVQKQIGHTTSDLPSGYPTSGEMNNGQNEDFTSFTGSPAKPTGYILNNDAVVGPPQTDIRRNGFSNSIRVINNGTSVSYISNAAPTLGRNVGLVKGRWYAIRLEFVTIGGLNNRLAYIIGATCPSSDLGKNGSGVSSDYQSFVSALINQTTTTGNFLIYYFQASGDSFELYFGGDAFFGGGVNRTQFGLQYIRIWDIETPTTETVDTAIPYLTADTAITLSSSDLSGIATDIGDHEIGYHYENQVTVLDAVQDCLRPFLGYYYIDQTGTMRFGRLVPPEFQNVTQTELTGSGNWTVPDFVDSVEVLVVAGGGGGGVGEGSSRAGAGGGGGEVVHRIHYKVTPGEDIAYSVGGGGVNGFTSSAPSVFDAGGKPGGNSTFGSIEANGGQGGEGYDSQLAAFEPSEPNTGSGGGAAGDGSARSGRPGVANEPDGLVNAGGANDSSLLSAGGGGGASEPGQDASGNKGGDGGDGIDLSHRFGTSVGANGVFAGGGGGGGNAGSANRGQPGAGNAGFGGYDSINGGNASSGTGSGGGGAGDNATTGGGGGSGTIIVRYGQPSTVLDITVNNILIDGEPRIKPDLMPGLSDSFGGRKNFTPIDETAGGATVDIEDKELFGRDFRIISRGELSDLDPFYAWAHDRCIVDTSIQNEAELTKARDYVAKDIAGKRRYFISVSVAIPPDTIIDPGDYVTITYPRFGLDLGVYAVVVSVRRKYRGSRADLILWR